MLKKTIQYGILTLSLCFLVCTYLIYQGQNSISLMLNLGTTVPQGLQDISMKGRRAPRLFMFNNPDEYFSASARTTKLNFMNWLKKSNFEVIYYHKGKSENFTFCSNFDSLPEEIASNKIAYSIQLSREIADSPQLHVEPDNDQTVSLQYNMDWN